LTSFSFDGVTAIIFDLDSTLIDTHSYPIRAVQWLLSKMNETSNEVQERYLRSVVHHYFRLIRDIAEGASYIPPLQVVREAMRLSLFDNGLMADSDTLDAAALNFKSLHVELSTPYPGVNELLKNLQDRNYKMAVITNSFEGNAEIILQKSGMDSFFDVVLDGAAIQGYKPMRRVFDIALESLSTSIGSTLFVGDEYYADIVGAAKVGMRTIWINARNRDLETVMDQYKESITPDLILNKVSALVEYL